MAVSSLTPSCFIRKPYWFRLPTDLVLTSSATQPWSKLPSFLTWMEQWPLNRSSWFPPCPFRALLNTAARSWHPLLQILQWLSISLQLKPQVLTMAPKAQPGLAYISSLLTLIQPHWSLPVPGNPRHTPDPGTLLAAPSVLSHVASSWRASPDHPIENYTSPSSHPSCPAGTAWSTFQFFPSHYYPLSWNVIYYLLCLLLVSVSPLSVSLTVESLMTRRVPEA